MLQGTATAGVGLGALALVGCGEDDADVRTPTPIVGDDTDDSVAPGDEEPRSGGTFVYSQSGEPPHLDISETLSFGLHSPVAPIYSRLVRTVWPSEAEHEGDFTIMPDLAEEWEIEDLQTYIFHLRPDARWHDHDPVNGREVDSEDVKVTFDKYRTAGAHTGAFSPVEAVETPDERTVVVRMSEPFSLFMETVSNAVRHIFPREVPDREDGLRATPVIGSGAFVFESMRRGDHIIARRNPDYFIPEWPYLDGYEYRFVPDASTRIAQFRAGETHYLGLASWDAAQEVMRTTPDALHEEGVPGHSVFQPAMDLRNPPFNDERVRRALSLAYDREATIDALFHGRGIQGWGVPWMYAQDEPWSQEQLPWSRFDPEEANQLLSASGHEGFETTMIFFAYTELMESQIQLFQADMLANLGVNMRLQPMEYSGWFETFADRGDWEGMAWGFQIGTSSTTDEFMFQNLHSTSPANHYYVDDPDIDDLVSRIRRTEDEEDRRAMVGEVHAIDQEMVYRLPSPYQHGHALIDPRFRNWRPPLTYRGNVGYGSAALTQHWFAEAEISVDGGLHALSVQSPVHTYGAASVCVALLDSRSEGRVVATYTAKRFVAAIPTLILTSLIVFSLMRLLPGDVVNAMLADSASATDAERERLRAELGLDRSYPVQYGSWLFGFVTGDMGRSIYTGEPISESLRRTVPVTAQLAVLGIIISVGVGIPLGLVSAIARNSPWDNLLRAFSILGLSAPQFWTGTMAITFIAIWFQWVPPTGYRVITSDPAGTLAQLALPALLVGYTLMAGVIRMTRSAVLEVMREDFVRTAHSKGLAPRNIWTRHVLRIAMLPVVTIIGGQVLAMLSGTVIIEVIFGLPGLGRLTLDAITFRDYPLVQSIVLVFAILVVAMNVLIDLSYAWLDPRIRYS